MYYSIKGKSLSLSKSYYQVSQDNSDDENEYSMSRHESRFEKLAKVRRRKSRQSLSFKPQNGQNDDEYRKSMDLSTITASGTKMTTFYKNSKTSENENESSKMSEIVEN